MKYLCGKFVEKILDMAFTAAIGEIISYVTSWCWNQASVQEMRRKFEELLVRAKMVNPTAQQSITASFQVQQLLRELQNEAEQGKELLDGQPTPVNLSNAKKRFERAPNFTSQNKTKRFSLSLSPVAMDDIKNPLLPPSRPVIAPPPTSFAPAKKRITILPKKTPFRSWVRVDASTGAISCVSLDKVTLMRRCDLPARDLRLLDPLFLYPSTILGREKAIVVNLEKIRCIITADELLVSVQGLNGNAVGGEEWEYAEEVQRRHASRSDDLPFEFVALEVALEATSAYLDAQAAELEIEAYPLLDELTSKISTLNLERVRRLKSKLVALTRRVQKVRDEIEQLMDDDGDMAELYLTEKRHSIESFYTEHGTLGGPGMSASAPTSPFGSPTSTSAGLKKLERNFSLARSSRHDSSRSIETEKRDIEEIEMLLEAYFVVVDNTLNKLMSLKEYIDDTEDFINIKLDNVRNQLIQFELLLTTATFVVAIFGVVAGIFGMNFEISLFDVPEAFNWVLGISGMAGIIIFSGFFWCFKRRRLIPL